MNLAAFTFRLFMQFAAPSHGDPFPYFKADAVEYTCEAPHWKATECGASDARCIRNHDQRVQDIAVMVGDRELCRQAVFPYGCVDVVDMVTGRIPDRRTAPSASR